MRLLVIMAKHSPWSQSVAVSLSALGHEVHVVDVEKGSRGGIWDPAIAGIRDDYSRFLECIAGVYSLTPPFGGSLRYVWAVPELRRLSRRLEVDMLLTLYGGGFGLLAYLSGIRPYCIYVVGSDVLLASASARQINRRTFRAAEQIFANGRYLADRARAQVPGTHVSSILIGIDTKQFSPADFSRRPIQLICTRGFRELYQNDAIVRALAMLPDGLPEFRMIFTSGGEGLPSVRALADRLLSPAVRRRVEFLGGVSHGTIRETLSRSHLFVSMSRSDGTATSLLEALGAGLFPVLSDIAQNREWIDRSAGNGRLVSLNDDNALAKVLKECIERIDLCAIHSERNRRMVNERADAGITRLALSEALEEALSVYRKSHG